VKIDNLVTYKNEVYRIYDLLWVGDKPLGALVFKEPNDPDIVTPCISVLLTSLAVLVGFAGIL
jgi:hypothetical protein